MSVPKKKRTSSSKKRRASHFALSKSNLSKCSQCQKPVLPHRACKFCGLYAGRQVVKVKSSVKTKKEHK